MKMHAPAHRRDDVLPARHAHTTAAAPTLQLASLIGNHAMRRLLTAPVVQRSFWDEVTEAASGVSDWFGGGDAVAEPPPVVEEAAPMTDPAVVEDVREEAGADDATDEGSWFENWFGEKEQEQEDTDSTTGTIYIEPEAERVDECAQLEARIADLSEYLRRLYEQIQALLQDLEAAKAQAEALERDSPDSPQAAEANQRYEELVRGYNALVDECLYLMEMRDGLGQQLDDCLNQQENRRRENLPLS